MFPCESTVSRRRFCGGLYSVHLSVAGSYFASEFRLSPAAHTWSC